MDKKGQIGIGIIMVTFIAVLTGLILFQAVAQSIGSSTTTVDLRSLSLGTATNGTAIYLADYKSITGITIYNGTSGGLVISSGNYTVTNNVINPATGGLSASILPKAGVGYYGNTWYLNATTAEPVGYISDAGGRAVAGLIAIFFALAIAVVALEPTLRSKIIEMVR